MSENQKHTGNHPIPRQVISSFDESERDAVTELWKTAERPVSIDERVSRQETSEALEDLHIRLGFSKQTERIAGSVFRFTRFAAAAVALIILGGVFLMIPQSVEIPPGETAVVSLPDGSDVELNSGSIIQFNRLFGYTNRDISLNGEGFFDVSPDEIPFRVTSNGTVTEVLGTRFNVRSWSDHPQKETRVAVEEGVVSFYPVLNNSLAVRLQKTDQSEWRAGLQAPTDPVQVDPERIAGWRDQQFIFYEETVQQIFRELERRFDTTITLENREAADETLTGYYGSISDPEALLDDICTVAGLNYSKTNGGYRVY